MVIVGSVIVAALLAVLLRQKIEKTIGLAITLLIFPVELCLVWNIPSVGAYLVIGIEIAALFGLGYCVFKRWKDFKNYIFTYGGFAVVILLLALMYYSIGKQAIYGPDPMFWVGKIKEILYWNNTQVLNESIHPYLLFSLGYMAVKSWPRWAEGILLFAKDFYVATLFVPFFAIAEKKAKTEIEKVIIGFSVFIMVLLLPSLGSGDSFGVFCVDSIMAALIGMGLVFLCEALESGNRTDFWSSVIYFAAAVLTKRIAVVAVGILFLFLIPYLKKAGKNKWGIILTVVTFCSYVVLWQYNHYALALPAGLVVSYLITALDKVIHKIKIDSRILFAVISSAFMAVLVITKSWIGTDWFKNDVFRIYVKGVFTSYKYSVGSVVQLSVSAMIILGAFLYFLLVRNKNSSMKSIFAIILGSNVVYVVVFSYLYVRYIAPGNYIANGQYIAAFDRYMSYIVILVVLFTLYVLIKIDNDKAFILLAVLGLIMISDIEKPFQYFTQYREEYNYYGFEAHGITLKDDDVVAYIDMDSTGYIGYRLFAFDLFCLPTRADYIDMSSYMNDDEEIDFESLCHQLAKYDYIYVQFADEQLASIFEEEVKSGDVYVYDSDSDKLVVFN